MGYDYLPRVDIDVPLRCEGCGIAFNHQVALLSDWRDRTRTEDLARRYPQLPCPACGAQVDVPAPVIVLRPGDPIPVLFCVPPSSGELLQAFESALAAYATNSDGIIPGPVASTGPKFLTTVAAEYSGFALAGLSAAGQQWAKDPDVASWISAMRRNHPWPDILAGVRRFLEADSEADALDVLDGEPELADPVWEPVVRKLGMLTLEAQPTPAAAEAVRARMRRLAAYRLEGRRLDTAAPEVREAVRLLSEMTTRQASLDRRQGDVVEAIAFGRELITHATSAYGPTHPLTLTALNDT
ncbi:MAG: tetratricopeptide repeat protein, partial [Actinobacteria bacterium]|nr:tetratricopeptide repeat protein [Actinomycetota bacterium]